MTRALTGLKTVPVPAARVEFIMYKEQGGILQRASIE